jgi:hypothetical protein
MKLRFSITRFIQRRRARWKRFAENSQSDRGRLRSRLTFSERFGSDFGRFSAVLAAIVGLTYIGADREDLRGVSIYR